MSFSDRFERIYHRILPSPFSIAILLTVFTFLLALFATRPEEVGYFDYSLELLGKWEAALWDDSKSGLYFAFQMMLMLLLGHVIALSQPASRIINLITATCTNTAKAALVVCLASLLGCLFNWGLGLVFGAILARKVGEKFQREQKSLNYALIAAAAYSGMMIWHGGLSGSAPIKAHEPNNLRDLVSNVSSVNLEKIPTHVEMSSLTFSPMNIFVVVLAIIVLPALLYLLGKRNFKQLPLPSEPEKQGLIKEQISGVEHIDHMHLFNRTIGILILSYAFYKAFILPDQISLNFLTPNFINLTLLGFAITSHRSITHFIHATDKAISGTSGILIQFPLYFGIMGLMVGSGLINEIANFFVSISTRETYPFFTFFSAAIVNIFVPSGGGQWAVQGPVVIAAAQSLNLDYGKSIMALAYGDQLTNMIQPFWALPLLGITGLKAKEIIPYTLIIMVAGLVIFMLGMSLF